MTFEEALDHSFERLSLIVRAKRRQNISHLLDTVLLIAAGVNGDKKTWSEKVSQLIDELRDE